jgi:tRNA U34 5-methylaminomethyl-2-thiouridine-forming methyltransferase MnmC
VNGSSPRAWCLQNLDTNEARERFLEIEARHRVGLDPFTASVLYGGPGTSEINTHEVYRRQRMASVARDMRAAPHWSDPSHGSPMRRGEALHVRGFQRAENELSGEIDTDQRRAA